MKKPVIILILALRSCQTCPAITETEVSKLLPALIQVESGGDNSAIGDSGNAIGCLQIWPVMVEDVNRVSGQGFTLNDRLSRHQSLKMARIYFRHYGKGWNIEQAARCWNGGPTGNKKKATLKYWEKVKKELND